MATEKEHDTRKVFRPVPATKAEVLAALDAVTKAVKADTLDNLQITIHGRLQGDPADAYGRMSVIRRMTGSLDKNALVEIGKWENMYGLPEMPVEEPAPTITKPDDKPKTARRKS